MDKRYQIFISSTFADLKEEREKVMRAILELKCFPAGMELFKAGSKPKFDQISSVIDECDFYILIIGARYGSMDKDGVSWTEKEYNYAMNNGVPVYAFIHGDSDNIPLRNADLKNTLRKKLKDFKDKVEEKSIVSYWKNADELKANVLSTFHDVLEQEKKEQQPRIGWVRADKVISADSQKEIVRLQKEITKHLDEIDRLKAELKKKEALLKGKEALLMKKETDLEKKVADYNALNSSYQAVKQEIENHKDGIKKALEAEEERFRASHIVSQSQTGVFTVDGVSFKLVLVEGGTFMMGANKGDEDADIREKPAHEVTLSDYWIGETQVTQALWQAVMGKNPSTFKGDLNRPVESVSWNDCQKFIKELNTLTGKQFRLPTEAEWEFAARGGNLSKGYKYAGSDTLDDVAWYYDNSGALGYGHPDDGTHAVATKDPNELGLYDMSGNVREWCQDRYEAYSGQAQTNPIGPDKGYNRLLRGGCWGSDARHCSVSHRSGVAPESTFNDEGLRLALSSL